MKLPAFVACSILLFLLPAVPAFAQRPVSNDGHPRWEEMVGCRLPDTAYADGDSFRLRHRGREYVFRLYLVDTPETVLTFPDRVRDQAAYFGISSEDAVRLGKEAQVYTGRWLASGCTVDTCWQNAQGMGALPRFYATVWIRGTNLATELVRQGYARIHATNVSGLDKARVAGWLEELRAAENDARTHHRGGWDTRRYPNVINRSAPSAAAPTVKIDLNSATLTDLERLPGIGPKLAQRIIAARPYERVADLIRVDGIGPKTLAGLTNLVRTAE